MEYTTAVLPPKSGPDLPHDDWCALPSPAEFSCRLCPKHAASMLQADIQPWHDAGSRECSVTTAALRPCILALHQCRVSAVDGRQDTILSGSYDGIVRIWTGAVCSLVRWLASQMQRPALDRKAPRGACTQSYCGQRMFLPASQGKGRHNSEWTKPHISSSSSTPHQLWIAVLHRRRRVSRLLCSAQGSCDVRRAAAGRSRSTAAAGPHSG